MFADIWAARPLLRCCIALLSAVTPEATAGEQGPSSAEWQKHTSAALGSKVRHYFVCARCTISGPSSLGSSLWASKAR